MGIIDGKKISEDIISQTRAESAKLSRRPVLVMFLVGNDPSSEIYVCKKEESCVLAGIESRKVVLPEETTTKDLISQIETFNSDDEVDAILVQLPLPEQINEIEVLSAVSPEKDIDCLNPESFGLFCEYGSKGRTVIPITALSVIEMLELSGVEIYGKHAVVVGNSNIVGKPTALMLTEKGATVTICHEKTDDIKRYTKDADILVVAAGKKHLIKADMVKPGVAVIDVGINRESGKIYGDVDFEKVSQLASHITPVPGGVGPVTVAMLLKNTLRLFIEKQKK